MTECKELCRESIEKSLKFPFTCLVFLLLITVGSAVIALILSEFGFLEPHWDCFLEMMVMLFLWGAILFAIKGMIPETCSKVCGKLEESQV